MGLFNSMLSGVVGAQMAAVVGDLIERHGGVQGLIAQMQQQGLGAVAQSWVGSGPNAPISAQQIHAAFDPSIISELAQKFGLHSSDLAQKLSQALPQVVDHLSPNGSLAGTQST